MPRPNKAEQKFALDVVDSCTADIIQAHAAYAGDADKLKNKLSYAKHVIVKWYMGEHAQCRKHFLVCKGRIINNWVGKSSYL